MSQILLNRRTLVASTFSIGILTACSTLSGRPHSFRRDPFTLGVAAGDPAPDGFVIWTRLAPEPLAPDGGMPPASVPVAWEVASDSAFRNIVRKGEALARAQSAHTVHVDCTGLEAHRPYWYRFHAGGATSEIGRARTLPAPGARVDQLRIASVGCQDFESGFYTAYAHLAAEPELDAVFHYGDYIYEFGRRERNPHRIHAGDETYTLEDYRRRYAQYKQDPDLRAAHARAVFITSFDDHEVDDNWAAAIGKDDGATAAFAARKAAALQAWREHMPVRAALQPGHDHRYFRRFDFGNLARMHVLDTRSHRSEQLGGGQSGPVPRIDDVPSRTMLGQEQEAWLGRGLSAEHGWNFIAQQVMVMPFDVREDGAMAPAYSTDNWNGYPAARRRMADIIAERGLRNVVIGSGDMHQHVVGYLPTDPDDPASPALASEFLASSITSGGSGSPRHPFQQDTLQRNPHLKLLNNQRGYQLYRLSPQRWVADVKVMDQVDTPGGQLATLASFVVEQGRPGPQPV
ncbi:alkaline phosphatase D family protein [Blastomonas sp.]|uniref:alkaline phosphatase D family protein n=1 Tax=Blastomonas sp. TaxID=1909299 RepID=UPI00391B20A4